MSSQSPVGAAVPGITPRAVSQAAGTTVASITMSKVSSGLVREIR